MTNKMNAKMTAAWKAVDAVDAGYLFEVIDLYDALAAYGFAPPRRGAVAVVEPEYEEILSEDF